VATRPLVRFSTLDSQFGSILLLGTQQGLAKVVLDASMEMVQELDRVSRRLPSVVSNRKGFPLTDALRKLKQYFDGQRVSFSSIPLDLSDATVFQKRVWELTSTVKYGSVRSYGWLARSLGDPESARAVGQALSRNPIPIIIPCHRIIEESGRRGGFSAGLRWKGSLLELEGGEQRLRWRERRRRRKQ